ncbi:MAG: amidohydrolase [Synergistaceae bacterium]|jgi:amidohydrolase|nr:amidohydrolase [Synergistaceae bacterium]
MEDLTQKILESVDEQRGRMKEIADKIWELAELGGKEFESSAMLMDELERGGFAVERGLVGKSPGTGAACDMPTAFKATLGDDGGPSVGIMLEYDALPNGHSCGHNLIAAAGLSAALALRSVFDKIPGRLVVMGTPAEEGGAPGKTEILHAGHFGNLDAVIMAHPSDRWNTGSRFLSIVQPKGGGIVFRGAPSHASSEPERGRSALDAVLVFCNGIEFLREHVRDGSRLHYVITNGGEAPNIVPDFASVNIYVRSEYPDELERIKKRVDDIIRGASLITDTTYEYEWDFPWYSPIKAPAFYALVEECAGIAGVARDEFIDYDSFGSTDAGNVGLEFPLVHLDFRIAPLGTNWHSGDSAEASRSEEGVCGMIKASKAMALSLYRIVADPGVREKIKKDFVSGKNG